MAITLAQQPYDVDVAIIGAGSAGLRAYRAALAHTDRVALIEGGPYGTTCARVGCMPSKLLISAADAVHHVEQAGLFGVEVDAPVVNGPAVMDRVRRERDRFVGFVVESTEAIDEAHRIKGYARFIDAHTLQIGDRRLTVKSVVIATGSRPNVLPMFEGLGDRLIVNDDIFDWTDLPASVAVFGPGVIGLELGQALARLGVKVRIFGKGGFVGPITDPVLLAEATALFQEELALQPDAEVHSLERVEQGVAVTFDDANGERVTEIFEYVLAATGRRANVDSIGLEHTGLTLDRRGVPVFDSSTMQAGNSHIFIAGDVNNDRPLLHEAADEGAIAGDNAARWPAAAQAGLRRSPIAVVFSDPQIALVGQTHRALVVEGADFVIGDVSFADQGRSRVMGVNRGSLRVYASVQTGRFLGAEMVGPRAEHMAHLLAWSHQQGLTIDQMLDMPFYHPVVEEGLRTALRNAQAALRTASRFEASA
ncbi:MAG: dihydrolipoyl dehydrogenase [Bradymonadia bacterium]